MSQEVDSRTDPITKNAYTRQTRGAAAFLGTCHRQERRGLIGVDDVRVGNPQPHHDSLRLRHNHESLRGRNHPRTPRAWCPRTAGVARRAHSLAAQPSRSRGAPPLLTHATTIRRTGRVHDESELESALELS
jgi:hypothetical protein